MTMVYYNLESFFFLILENLSSCSFLLTLLKPYEKVFNFLDFLSCNDNAVILRFFVNSVKHSFLFQYIS